MCLYAKDPIPRIAKEDIICYKVVDKDFKSPMLGFQYKLNTLYELPYNLEVTREGLYLPRINEGFHAYLNTDCALRSSWNKKCITLNQWTGSGENYYIAECIIPVGAEFYIGFDNESIVSNKIKITEFYEKSTLL